MAREKENDLVSKRNAQAKERRSESFKKRHGNSKLDEAMMNKMRSIIPNMMGQGATRIEIVAELGIHRDTLHAWERENPEISDLLHLGDVKKEAWWMSKGRHGIEDKNFNANQYKWMTQNLIDGWSNKQDINANVQSTTVIQEKARERVRKAKENETS